MKLKHFSEEGDGGVSFSVTVVSVEGIWHLFNLLSVGDTIRTRTVRKVAKEGMAAQKKTLTLSISITQPVVYDSAGILRISGINRTECEDVRLSAAHTSTVCYDPPQDVKVWKSEWNSVLDDRLKTACDPTARADAAAVMLQQGAATVCLLSGTLTTVRAKLEASIPKKGRRGAAGHDDAIKKFYGSVMDAMMQHIPLEKVKAVLVCGPGTVSEEFLTHASAEAKKAEAPANVRGMFGDRGRFVATKVSSGAKHALREALADKDVAARMADARCVGDLAMWTKFQDMMNRDPERATYGVEQVWTAAQDGAVELMLMLDVAMRSPEPIERHFYAALVEEVLENGGTTHVVSTQGAEGEQLHFMGGIAAVLRQPMPQLDEIEGAEGFTRSEAAAAYVRGRNAKAAGMGAASPTGASGTKSFSGADGDA